MALLYHNGPTPCRARPDYLNLLHNPYDSFQLPFLEYPELANKWVHTSQTYPSNNTKRPNYLVLLHKDCVRLHKAF